MTWEDREGGWGGGGGGGCGVVREFEALYDLMRGSNTKNSLNFHIAAIHGRAFSLNELHSKYFW